MKKYLLLLIPVLMILSACTAQADENMRILIYTKNGEGYVHDNIAASVAALEKICTAEGIATDVSDQPIVFTEENLKQYDAIVFSNSNNEGFDTEQQKEAFQAYIRSGKGFAAIHSANATEREWPWYWAMVGGKFIRHAPYQEFDILVTDPEQHFSASLNRVGRACNVNHQVDVAADRRFRERRNTGKVRACYRCVILVGQPISAADGCFHNDCD